MHTDGCSIFCVSAGAFLHICRRSAMGCAAPLMKYLEGKPKLQGYVSNLIEGVKRNCICCLAMQTRTGVTGEVLSTSSMSSMLMLYNKSPISWKSKMQKTTAASTAEAEKYSASMTATKRSSGQIEICPEGT
jgi:hypothetical protein